MNDLDRDTFIVENIGLVKKIANQFRNRIYYSPHVEMDDLIQIGTIGLIKACDRFDPENGTKISTYATTSIKWEIQMFLKDKLDGVKIGGNTVYNYLNILQSGLIKESPAVISAILDLPIQSVESALAYHRCKYMDSLDRPISNDDGDSGLLGELIGYEVHFDENLEKDKLNGLLKKFNKRTQEIFELRLQDFTQKEIAESLGLSQSYIARLLMKARKQLEKGGIQMSKDKKRDFKLAEKLALETELGPSEISKKTGVSYTTAYNYIQSYRASEEEIREVKERIENSEPPIKSYKLSPEELEKYRNGDSVLKVTNSNPVEKESRVEITQEVKTPDYVLAKKLAEVTELNADEISDKTGISLGTAKEYIQYYRKINTIVKEEMEDKPIQAEVNSYGHTSMVIETPVHSSINQLYKIIKAMDMLGFEYLKITVQGEKLLQEEKTA